MELSHAGALEAKHAGLARKIEEESRRPAPDTALIAELKKAKLKIKDALSSLH